MRRIILLCAFLMTSGSAWASSPYFVEPDVNVLFSAFGEQSGDGFGWAAEDLGDINGDGASDFIVSAPFFVLDGQVVGRVYVYSGADGALLAVHTGQGPSERLGFGASLAGDLDGDGVNDYIAGSLLRVVAWSGADHSVLWQREGNIVGYGWDVDTAGDLDGDGHDDVLVGENYAFDETHTGTVYALSGVNGSVLWSRDGDQPGDRMGSAVGRLGDINHDGIPDVVVGERAGGLHDRGVAYALSGLDGSVLRTMHPVGEAATQTPASTYATFHGAGGGDVDGDGINDIYIGDYSASVDGVDTGRAYIYSGRTGHKLMLINAEAPGDGIGPGRIVHDVNHDGRDDIYVASYLFGAQDVGKAYVMTLNGHGQRQSRGRVLRSMTGTVPNAQLGIDAVGLRDINGDGKTDFLLTGNGVIHVIAGN